MTSVRLIPLATAFLLFPGLVAGSPPPAPSAMMPMISLSSDVVDFGPELVGRTSPARQIVITNNGDAPLQFMGLALMGGDVNQFAPAMVPTQFPVTIQPGQANLITYVFKPTSDGLKKTTLSITSNDPSKPESTVQLSGTGIANPITVAPAKIDFGVAPIPSIGGQPAKPFVGVLGCMVTAPSQLKDIAREFLEQHVLSLPGLKTISADVPLGTPANKAYYAELAADPRIAATMANVRAGEPIPNIPETGRFWPALDAALEAITQGRQTPKEALDGAAARMLVK